MVFINAEIRSWVGGGCDGAFHDADVGSTFPTASASLDGVRGGGWCPRAGAKVDLLLEQPILKMLMNFVSLRD